MASLEYHKDSPWFIDSSEAVVMHDNIGLSTGPLVLSLRQGFWNWYQSKTILPIG